MEASQGTMYHPLVHLAVYTGLRRSELLGLRWRDVDLDMATFFVVQVLHQLRDGRLIFNNPKSGKSRRQVALSPSSALVLRAHREQQGLERSLMGIPLTLDGLVFSHPDGSPLLPNTVTHAFIKIVRRVGLEGIRFHDLRHTHASLMLRQGVHPKIVSECLGHATVSITPWTPTRTSHRGFRKRRRGDSMRAWPRRDWDCKRSSLNRVLGSKMPAK